MEQNYTPLPAKFEEKGSPISLKYIVGSFIIFFIVGASILTGIFFTFKKSVSESEPAVPTSIPQAVYTLPSPTIIPLPTVSKEEQVVGTSTPDDINIGSVEADLNDLQKDLSSL